MPSVVNCGSKPPFCPRCAAVMKARDLAGPANTMSRGSSPTSSVRFTVGGLAATSTMLTRSESRFTTHTSPFDRAATATGSRPTGTEPVCTGEPLTSARTARAAGDVSLRFGDGAVDATISSEPS